MRPLTRADTARISQAADALYAERAKAHPEMLDAAMSASARKDDPRHRAAALAPIAGMDRVFAGADAHRAYCETLRRTAEQEAA